MDDRWNKDEEEEIEMLNGRALMSALEFLKPEATEKELLKCFTTPNDDSHSLIEQELKRILDNGVIDGFIAKNNDKYSIPILESEYQVDCDEKDRRKNKGSTHTRSPIVIKFDIQGGLAVQVRRDGTDEKPITISHSAIVEIIDGNISVREMPKTNDLTTSKRKLESTQSGPAKRVRGSQRSIRSSGGSRKSGGSSGAGVC